MIFNTIALVFSLIFQQGQRYYLLGAYLSAILLTFVLGVESDSVLNSFRRQAKVLSGLLFSGLVLATALLACQGIRP